MKLGIMQPYFMPYIGYWQLLNSVDKYVVYDDVNFIKGGWINRNRILLNGEIKYLNVPMLGASSFKKINEIYVNSDKRIQEKNLKFIESAYRKSPFFSDVFELLEGIIRCDEANLAVYIASSIRKVMNYLGISTEIIFSSQLEKDCSLKGQEKVLEICRILGATEYYNAVGGQSLYSFDEFEKRGIALKFMQTDNIEYKQFESAFVPNLSIIDVMMFNTTDDIAKMLTKYSLIENEEIR